MKIQIYTMQTPEEAQAVIDLGVDHIGVTPANRGLPGEVDFDTARAICAAVGSRAVKVALSVEADPDAITAMVRAVQPDVLHLCGLAGAVPPDVVRALRARLPGVRIMQAISVAGPEAIDTALAYQPVADYLILDTQAPDIAGIGASGQTHDWTISRRIVERVAIPGDPGRWAVAGQRRGRDPRGAALGCRFADAHQPTAARRRLPQRHGSRPAVRRGGAGSARSMNAKPVVVVGDANVDLVIRLPDRPKQAADLTQSVPQLFGGGSAANTAVALARLGVRTAFVGAIGDDGYGRYRARRSATRGDRPVRPADDPRRVYADGDRHDRAGRRAADRGLAAGARRG